MNKDYVFARQKGFTLWEILVVIAILGILAATLVPTIGQLLPGWQLNGSARTLTSKLRQAQEEAVTSQKQHLVRFNLGVSPITYQLIKIDSGEHVLENLNFPASISVTIDETITDNQIVFSSDGGPSANGNITLTFNGNHKIISVSPAGVIKLE